MSQKLDVLIIDDDPGTVQTAGALLGDEFELRFALSGDEGLRMVKQRQPDLVLLDIDMPGMSGLKVAAALRAEAGTKKLPIIFVTTHKSVPMAMEAFRSGGDDYVTKPLNKGMLLGKIRSVMSARQ